jgi:diguanylate cyclase (GGDEF)-like protein
MAENSFILKTVQLRQKPYLVMAVSFTSLVVIGYIDFAQGYRFSFSIFYLLPIAYITWHNSRLQGILFSVLSAITWFNADYFARTLSPDLLVLAWNSALRLGFFLIVTFLLAALRQSLEREKKIARHDHLTNAWNRMAFYELCEIEIARARRYPKPLSIAYIDVDNFKRINDEKGHQAGDSVLREISSTITESIRKSDIFSRLGGDEFIILLPETDGKEAQILIQRIKNRLMMISESNDWPVTYSIGIVSFISAPVSVEEMIHSADTLMYTAKRTSKNRIVIRSIK